MHDQYATPSAQKETPVLNSMNQKAVSNNVLASAILDRLSGVCERLRGAIPEAVGGGLEKGKPHAGMIGSLEIEIGTTSNILSAMQNRLTELERFI